VNDLDLDGLLEDWAAGAQLTAREADDVRTSVLATRPAGLDPAWWSGLMGQVSATVIQAVPLPSGARSALALGWAP
jgi:hypothetical protein